MNPICFKCKCEMKCMVNGIIIEELSSGEPYRLWGADMFECPTCKTKIISGVANMPIAEISGGAEPYTKVKEMYAKHTAIIPFKR